MKKTIFFLPILLCFFLSILAAPAAVTTTQMTKDSILQTSQAWKDNYLNYRVDESFLDTLKSKVDNQLTIDVYLGTWCSDSLNNVPSFIKIIELLDRADLPVRYFNVDRKPSQDVKFFVEDLKVERVPTFIFYRSGTEIGRIIENPKKSLIEDFIAII